MVALLYWGYCWHSFVPLIPHFWYIRAISTAECLTGSCLALPVVLLVIYLYIYLCTMDIVHLREEVDIEKGLQTYNLRFSGSNTDCKQLIQLKLILHFHATWKSCSIVVFRGYSSWTLKWAMITSHNSLVQYLDVYYFWKSFVYNP